MKRIFFLLFLAVQATILSAQHPLLQSGPMVGRSEMREVVLWAQTKEAARVKAAYWESGNPKAKMWTREVITREDSAFTAHLLADQVLPGRKYEYQLYINKKPVSLPYPTRFQTPPLWQWRTDPPEFTIALGSCTYVNDSMYDRPGKPYGGDYQIFKSIHAKSPDLMLWLGDNTYLREADWNTRTGIMYRYTHSRSLPEIQPLLASSVNYAIWDDHDYGPNDADRSYMLKNTTLEAFKLFWANPTYGVPGDSGTTTSFQWGDAEFFMLDNRWFRTPNDRETGEQTILGDEQIRWLIDALVGSKATFKFVVMGGQFINPVAKFENYAIFPKERDSIISMITKENIPGVIFLSGDRHATELSALPREGSYPLYDLTVSPLTSGVNTYAHEEKNTLRIDGTLLEQRNFAVMRFSGPRTDRLLTITLYDMEGKELWNRTIKATDLKARK